MQIDYKKRHIETEKRFYQKMNKQKTLLITILIVGLGSLFLYYQYWIINQPSSTNLLSWTLMVGILFVFQTIIGHYLFEHERRKYIEK
jgi:hypothetical protein